MLTIDYVKRATRASVATGREDWSARINAYWRAYSRRLKREERRNGPFAKPSDALIALSSRMMDIVHE